MAFYRKKPVVIEAVRLEEVGPEGGRYSASFDDMPQWLKDAFLDDRIILDANRLLIRTLEGEMEASVGDWIIKGVKGELYPCKPDVFRVTYDPAAEPEREISGVAI